MDFSSANWLWLAVDEQVITGPLAARGLEGRVPEPTRLIAEARA